MLDKKVFLQGIKHLNAYYTNFNFNINDDIKLKVWYDVFINYTDTDYNKLIKSYCIENIYAPQSPTHLLDYAKSLIISSFPSADEAWEHTISLLRYLSYDFKRFYDKVDSDVISTVIKQMRADFVGLMTDQVPFVKKTFVKLYNETIQKNVSNQLREGLGWTTQVLLPKGES